MIQSTTPQNTQKKKAQIPRALREQVWIQNIGNKFETKCLVEWCQNKMNPFDFHVGHNIPESRGGQTNISNLKPICARCNLSMGSQYSIEEWSKIGLTDLKKLLQVPTVTVSGAAIKTAWWKCC